MFESLKRQQGAEDVFVEREKVPERFPVVEVERTYYYDEMPPSQEGVIVRYFHGNPDNTEKRNRYALSRIVAGLNYIFKLDETSTAGMYGLHFKTKEYELATVNLSDEGYKELAETIAAFAESVFEQQDSHMNEIHISPADTTYSAEDIEGCMEEILKSPKNVLTREELIRKCNGYKIFRLYDEMFDEDYPVKSHKNENRAGARARFFKTMFRKNLPNWEVVDYSGHDVNFDLVRKEGK